jgi:hypothetical protein
MHTTVEYKKIGKPTADTYIVLIDGKEVGHWCTEDTAKKVVAWIQSATNELKEIF